MYYDDRIRAWRLRGQSALAPSARIRRARLFALVRPGMGAAECCNRKQRHRRGPLGLGSRTLLPDPKLPPGTGGRLPSYARGANRFTAGRLRTKRCKRRCCPRTKPVGSRSISRGCPNCCGGRRDAPLGGPCCAAGASDTISRKPRKPIGGPRSKPMSLFVALAGSAASAAGVVTLAWSPRIRPCGTSRDRRSQHGADLHSRPCATLASAAR